MEIEFPHIPENLPPKDRATMAAGLICLALEDRIFGSLQGAAEPDAVRAAKEKRKRRAQRGNNS